MGAGRPSERKTAPPGPVRCGLALALLIALSALPTAADWLVTLDGDQVRTQGPWSIQGKLVVFTHPDSGLSSIRLADIDVDASDRLTAASRASRHGPKTEQPPREAVFVLTDNDVGHVDSRATGSIEERQAAGAEARAQAKRSSAATAEGLSVADWSQTFDDGINGVVITGRLENRSREVQTKITLRVVLYLTDGSLAGRAPATADELVLRPGASTSFKATFPGILGFDRPDFQIESFPFAPRAEGQPEQED